MLRQVCLASLVRGVAVVAVSLAAIEAPAQGRYEPVTEDDVQLIKLNHYFSADKKHHDPDFEWTFTKGEFRIRKGMGEIPVDLRKLLLPEGVLAAEIRGKWKIDAEKSQLVLTGIKHGKQDGRKEVRLPIYRTAPTVIRIGDPQHVFSVEPANPPTNPKTAGL